MHLVLKERPLITFWKALGEQFDFWKKWHEICNMGSVEDQIVQIQSFLALPHRIMRTTCNKISYSGFNSDWKSTSLTYTLIVTLNLGRGWSKLAPQTKNGRCLFTMTKFSITITFTTMETKSGNSALMLIILNFIKALVFKHL